MGDCPFCDYGAGRAVPDGGLLFDGASVIAFRPLHPFAPGHTLIVPRVHVESFLDADPVTSEGVAAVTRILARRKGPDGVNVITSAGTSATQTVMHWHVHLIPRQADDELGPWPWGPPRAAAGLDHRRMSPNTGIQVHVQGPPEPVPIIRHDLIAEAYERGRLGYPPP